MFQIKTCGIMSVEDALTVVRSGADAIGLNFYPGTPRYLSLDTARQIVAVLPKEVVRVGLFVNASPFVACRLYDDLQLDLIQLHGDEPPEYLAQLGARPVMRAFRLKPGKLSTAIDYLTRCRQLGVLPRLVIMDALVVGMYGGSGKTADLTTAKQYTAQSGLPPLVLAGGLTPDNVAEAIAAVRPVAVDVASGVESSPGHKDPAAVEAFVKAARAAFDP
jgi:phosphoribosylanthranilate isomerase